MSSLLANQTHLRLQVVILGDQKNLLLAWSCYKKFNIVKSNNLLFPITSLW